MPSTTHPAHRAAREDSRPNRILLDIEKAQAYEELDSSPTKPSTAKEDEEGRTVSSPSEGEGRQSEEKKSKWKKWTQRKEPPPVPTDDEDHPQNHRRRLSWQKLTICLIVEAIALGTLGMPQAFASMGMGLSICVSIGLGLIATYTALVIGAVKVKFPGVQHYADAVGLIFGRLGYETASFMSIALLVLLLGSHTLTGTIAFNRIVDEGKVCGVSYGAASAVLLFLLALPPSFTEFAILGYIDFGSIIIAISIVTVASGIHAFHLPGGPSTVDWNWAPPADMTFQSAFLGATNIIFAYTFAVAMFSFMAEMHDVYDHPKAVWTLGVVQTVIYTIAGALNYAWIGRDVESPALLSAEPRVVSRVAFGLALPVIYISGSINSNVVASYIFDRWLPGLRERRNRKFWIRWVLLLAGITVASWLIATSIPFFNALLGLISSLFTSGFTFYFPALFWFMLVKKGRWNGSWKNLALSALNVLVFTMGIVLLVCGTYVSVWQILEEYKADEVKMPFSCKNTDYRKEESAVGPHG